MQRWALWTTIIALFFLAWVGNRSLNLEPLCMRSDSVSTLVYTKTRSGEDEKSAFQVNGCDWRQWFVFESLPSELVFGSLSLPRLNRRIVKLEEFARSYQIKTKKLVLFIDDSDPFVYQRFQNKIRMGGDLARQELALEEAVLRIWLLDSHVQPLSQHWSFEVLVGFYLRQFSDRGGSFHSSRRGDQPVAGWLTSLQSTRSYCLSQNKSLIHLNYCNLQNSLASQKAAAKNWERAFSDPNLWALRPLMSEILSDYFMDLTPKRRYQFLNNLSQKQKSGDLPDVGLPENYSSYSSLTSWFQEAAMKIIGFAMDRIRVQSLADVLDRYGVVPNLEVDLMIEITDEEFRLDAFESLISWSERRQDKTVIVVDRKGQYVFPSGQPVAVRPASIQAKQHILVGCKFPVLNQIVDVQSEEFTVLKFCQDEVTPEWGQILQAGFGSFVSRHSDMQFISFHKPSLDVALDRVPEVGQVKESSIDRMDLWTRALKWEELEWDSAHKSYRPQGPVDAIQEFRIGRSKSDI